MHSFKLLWPIIADSYCLHKTLHQVFLFCKFHNPLELQKVKGVTIIHWTYTYSSLHFGDRRAMLHSCGIKYLVTRAVTKSKCLYRNFWKLLSSTINVWIHQNHNIKEYHNVKLSKTNRGYKVDTKLELVILYWGSIPEPTNLQNFLLKCHNDAISRFLN